MSKRVSTGKKMTATLPPSYAKALVAFKTYFDREGVNPSHSQLAEEMGRHRSSARQALDYLGVAGMVTHSGAWTRPWSLTPKGKRLANSLIKKGGCNVD